MILNKLNDLLYKEPEPDSVIVEKITTHLKKKAEKVIIEDAQVKDIIVEEEIKEVPQVIETKEVPKKKVIKESANIDMVVEW